MLGGDRLGGASDSGPEATGPLLEGPHQPRRIVLGQLPRGGDARTRPATAYGHASRLGVGPRRIVRSRRHQLGPTRRSNV